MLKQLITVATHEVALLQETDEHANVIRYFCKEQRDNFLYIALELCPRSLADLVERPAACEPDLVAALNPKQALRQITSGLAHLHRLKIVHRDIKPPNILVAQRRAPDGGLRMLISDFGLCKRLDGDASSFHQSVTYDAAGSIGWRAPEVLRGDVDPNDVVDTKSSDDSSSLSPSIVVGPPRPLAKRLTRSLDIFSLGCVAYYLLSSGEHPFGGRYERESNILKANYALDKLDGLGEEAIEAQSMIASMIAGTPADRCVGRVCRVRGLDG
jgi:serine/threonine-protein kinase/endoribonuclease IRE1